MHDQKKKTVNEPVDEKARLAQQEANRVLAESYRSVLERRTKGDYTRDALAATADVLEKIPEAYSLYSYRREILEHLWHSNEDSEVSPNEWLAGELALNSRVLLKDFKIYAAFVHRHWIFEKLAQRAAEEEAGRPDAGPGPTLNVLVAALQKDSAQCQKLLTLDERNFHAWNYRRWALQELQRATRLQSKFSPHAQGDTSVTAMKGSLYIPDEAAEVAFTTEKINRNFSNYSAWHQRGITIRAALTRHGALAENPHLDAEVALQLWCQLREDVGMLVKAIYCDPNDQAAWFYAPFVLDVFDIHHAQMFVAYGCAGSDNRCDEATSEESERLRRCNGDLMDVFVEATVDLMVEEQRLGASNECYLPSYFLFFLLVRLRQDVHGTANQRDVFTEVQKRHVAKLAQYTGLLQEKLYTDLHIDTAVTESSLRRLKDHLCEADALRSGMYTHLLSDALSPQCIS